MISACGVETVSPGITRSLPRRVFPERKKLSSPTRSTDKKRIICNAIINRLIGSETLDVLDGESSVQFQLSEEDGKLEVNVRIDQNNRYSFIEYLSRRFFADPFLVSRKNRQ